MATKVVVFYRKGEDFQYKNLSSLAGKRVGTVKGYHYGKEFDESTLFIRHEVSALKEIKKTPGYMMSLRKKHTPNE